MQLVFDDFTIPTSIGDIDLKDVANHPRLKAAARDAALRFFQHTETLNDALDRCEPPYIEAGRISKREVEKLPRGRPPTEAEERDLKTRTQAKHDALFRNRRREFRETLWHLSVGREPVGTFALTEIQRFGPPGRATPIQASPGPLLDKLIVSDARKYATVASELMVKMLDRSYRTSEGVVSIARWFFDDRPVPKVFTGTLQAMIDRGLTAELYPDSGAPHAKFLWKA